MPNKQKDNSTQIEDLIAIISHELKSPITALKMQTQLLHRRLQKSSQWTADDCDNAIANYDKQLMRLQHFVDSLLESARLEKIGPTPSFTSFNLSNFLKNMLDHLEYLIPSPQTHLQCIINFESDLVVCWDQFKIEQVIINLLLNAFKYAPGSAVSLHIISLDNDQIEISITDHGPGIPLEEQESIFEKFYRNNHSSVPGGLGLGLYIVKNLVKAHKGGIKVESEPGNGAKFILTFPRICS